MKNRGYYFETMISTVNHRDSTQAQQIQILLDLLSFQDHMLPLLLVYRTSIGSG